MVNGDTRSTAHTWIAGAALVWNLLGLMMFVMQVTMSPDQRAAMSAPERAVYDATPPWINAAFGVAVVTGVLGSIGLLLRRSWAVACFGVSLIAMIVQFGGAYMVTPAWATFGASGLVMPLVLLAIGAYLLEYARRATA
jgi:hypothetical protein